MEIIIKNVHVRFEDSINNFNCGFTFLELSIKNEIFGNTMNSSEDIIKLLLLQNISAYWNNNSNPWYIASSIFLLCRLNINQNNIHVLMASYISLTPLEDIKYLFCPFSTNLLLVL